MCNWLLHFVYWSKLYTLYIGENIKGHFKIAKLNIIGLLSQPVIKVEVSGRNSPKNQNNYGVIEALVALSWQLSWFFLPAKNPKAQ